jgi:Ni,Fe-hydrogenase III small subunit
MIKLFAKIFSNPNNVIPAAAFNGDADVKAIGQKIQEKVKKLFRGSLAIRQVDAGSDNAAEQELVALSNAFYDVERFNVHFVASPKHADMLMITGPVTRNMAEALRRAYNCTPDPKIIVAVGDDAIDGGIFKGSYAVEGGVASTIKVDYHIPGDPPSPKMIITHLLKILETEEVKRSNAN